MFHSAVGGIVAGWLADNIVRGGKYGLIGDLIVGVIGGFIGTSGTASRLLKKSLRVRKKEVLREIFRRGAGDGG